jgi:hypothetical protein
MLSINVRKHAAANGRSKQSSFETGAEEVFEIRAEIRTHQSAGSNLPALFRLLKLTN